MKTCKTRIRTGGRGPLICIAFLGILVAALLGGCEEKKCIDPNPEPPPAPFFYTEGSWLKDSLGRTVILRGCNYMGMEFGWFHHGLEDFERIKGWGFNIVRIPIAWAYLEPEPDVYDESYLAEHVDRVVDYCAQTGLHALIDMHQWTWSSCFGGNGAPAWTCAHYPPDLAGLVLAAGDFWRDDCLKEHLIEAWRLVARRYRDDTTVIGYDLFNEPNPGYLALPGIFDPDYLKPFYEELIDEIRAIDPHHLLFYEPSLNHSLLFPSQLGRIDRPNLVYAPHLYTGGTWDGVTGYHGTINQLRPEMDLCWQEAYEACVPLWIGEYGVGSAACRATEWIRDEVILQEGHEIGSAWWTYWRDDASMGLLDAGGQEKVEILDILSRPYPLAIAGYPARISYDVATRVFTMTVEEEAGAQDPTEIFVPADRHYAEGFTVSCNDAEGTWHWAWDEEGSVVRIWANREEPTHEISIQPSPRF